MNTKKAFTRVDLKSKKEHETKLSFYDDSGNEAFRYWWREIGRYSLAEWCTERDDFKWLVEDDETENQ